MIWPVADFCNPSPTGFLVVTLAQAVLYYGIDNLFSNKVFQNHRDV